MAKRTITTFYSDLSGDEIEGGGTTQFGIDGASYEIDLTSAEKLALHDALAPYIGAARTATSVARRISRPTVTDAPSAKEIRAWALENGYEVPPRGRIPALVLEAFNVAL